MKPISIVSGAAERDLGVPDGNVARRWVEMLLGDGLQPRSFRFDGVGMQFAHDAPDGACRAG